MLRDLRFVLAILVPLVLLVTLQFAQPLIVFGKAVDVAGKPIAGTLGASHYTHRAKDRAAERGGHTFFSGCVLCASLRLRVSAPGYETERLQLSTAHAWDMGDRVVAKRYLFGVIQYLRVTLFQERDVEAARIEAELIFADGTPRLVAALNPKLPRQASPETLNTELRRLTRGEQTNAAFIALDATVNDDGSITVAPLPTNGANRAQWSVAANARLVLHNVTGGFVAIPPLTGIPAYNGYRETLRRLRDAPLDGYAPVLQLDFNKGHIDGRHLYFYCRFGERFGKGEVSAIEVDRDGGKRLRAYLRIWMNAGGGRAMPIGY